MKQEAHQFKKQQELRTIEKDDGTLVYCLTDIAALAGYAAPQKFSIRCNFETEKLPLRWKATTKTGRPKYGTSKMLFVTYLTFLYIAKHYEFKKELISFVTSIENEHEESRIAQKYDSLMEEFENSKKHDTAPKDVIEEQKTTEDEPIHNIEENESSNSPKSDYDDLLEMINSIMYTCLELRKEIEKRDGKTVMTIRNGEIIRHK